MLFCINNRFSRFVSRELESFFYPFVCPPSRTSRVIIYMEEKGVPIFTTYLHAISRRSLSGFSDPRRVGINVVNCPSPPLSSIRRPGRFITRNYHGLRSVLLATGTVSFS